MIYDKVMTVCRLAHGRSPNERKLEKVSRRYYMEKSVYASRFYAGKQAGSKLVRMVVTPRSIYEVPIEADFFCILDDGCVYRIDQAQRDTDGDGLPCTTLALAEPEGKYELFQN